MEKDMKSLLKLTGLQMVGLIVIEVIIWMLIVVGLVPSHLIMTTIGVFEFKINTIYIVLVGVVAVLISAFWLALLVQYKVVKLKEVKIDFL